MEKKDLVSESNDKETTPLVAENKEVETPSTKNSSLSHLATELSELSLEVANKAISIIDGSTSGKEAEVFTPEATAPEAEAAAPESNQSVDDVEEMVVDQTLDTQEPQVDETQDRSETESPQESESENSHWLDLTTLTLVVEVLLLAFPVSMAYFGIAYFKDCEGGDKLPLLLIILAFLSSLILTGRIMIKVAKRLSFYDSNTFHPTAIYSGEFLLIALLIAEMAYIFTVDSKLCNETFFLYAFYMNNIALGFVIFRIFYGMKKLARYVSILRS